MILPIISTIIGVLLIGLTLFDVFVTVLHPQAESPFSSRLQIFVWAVLRLAARGLRGRVRHRFLGLAIPIMVAVLISVWLGTILTSFGVIYAAWITFPGAFRGPDPSSALGWGDAFYFSGVTLGTTGYGDFQPVHPLLRLTSVLEGFTGVVVLSLSIAYVLGVYPALQRQRVLAVLLNEETSGQVSGLPMLSRYLRKGNFEALAGLLTTINMEFLSLAESHNRLPILHFTHPTEPERSFLRILLVVQNLVGTLRYGVAGGKGRDWSDDPRVRDLEDSLFYTLYTLGSSKQLPIDTSVNNNSAKAASQKFDNLVSNLKALRLPTPSPEPGPNGHISELERARAGYIRFFAASDLPLLNYLRNSGYKYAEAIESAVRPQKLMEEFDPETDQDDPVIVQD